MDIKLYMQLHRKMMRKCVIEQKFEQSLYDFSNTVDRTRKGFRGALCHERSSTNRDIQHNRRMQTESAVFSLTKEN